MAIGKSNDEIIEGLRELVYSAPEKMAAKHSSTIATIVYRLKKLDKLEREALARKGLSGDNMGIELGISEVRVEDEQASPQTKEPAKKRGGKGQTANRGTCQKVSKAQ